MERVVERNSECWREESREEEEDAEGRLAAARRADELDQVPAPQGGAATVWACFEEVRVEFGDECRSGGTCCVLGRDENGLPTVVPHPHQQLLSAKDHQ